VKQFFFMAGLQRSGATVLSAILNQNPDLWVSPASPLFQMMVKQTVFFDELENKDFDRSESIASVISSTPHIFYADKNVKYVVDKNLNWTTYKGVETIHKYITRDIKIICPVRNILDILVSFDTIINASKDSQQNVIDERVLERTFPDKPLADRRADWLMGYDKDIPLCLHFMKNAMYEQHRNMFHFVDYDDFIANPQQEIEKIYGFLQIEPYTHQFDNIINTEGIKENSLLNIKNLHTIRPSLNKQSRKPEDVFQPQTIARYSNLEFWRNI
jgi:sulfotransferase